jgi:hypothetical protein
MLRILINIISDNNIQKFIQRKTTEIHDLTTDATSPEKNISLLIKA